MMERKEKLNRWAATEVMVWEWRVYIPQKDGEDIYAWFKNGKMVALNYNPYDNIEQAMALAEKLMDKVECYAQIELWSSIHSQVALYRNSDGGYLGSGEGEKLSAAIVEAVYAAVKEQGSG